MTTRTRAAYRALIGAVALAVVAVAGGGAFTTVASAQQAPPPECQPGVSGSAPAGDLSTPTEGARFGTPSLNVQGEFHYDRNIAGMPSGNTTITAQLVTCRSGQVLPEGSTSPTTTNGSNSVAFQWPTPALSWNGPYAVKVTVNSPAGNKTVTRTFAMVVAPVAPADVRAAPLGDGLNVSWAKNPEPDVVGYRVQRAGPSGPFQSVGDVPTAGAASRPSFLDHPSVGDWRYNVVALRYGASDTEGVASDPSPTLTTSFAAPPPPPAASGGSSAPPPTAAPAPANPATNAAIAKAGKVDLSSFSALLDARAKAAAKAAEEAADPGYQGTLPFKTGDQAALSDAAGKEAGGGQAQGAGQMLVSDESDRRRALSSLAAALLLFVMFMQVRWVRLEIDEVGDLEATVPEPPAPEPAPEPVHPSPPDDSGLDVPVALGQRPTYAARRASRRLPPRPTDDRGQGAAVVRARRRRVGGRDGRVPLG